MIAWERSARAHGAGPYALVHADYHWDAINDFHQDEAPRDQLFAADLTQLQMMVGEGNWIRYDSFIAPAVLRGLITQVHFFCLQDDDEPGLDDALLHSTGVRQILHPDVQSLAQVDSGMPLIFDLCLDLFNRSDQMYTSDLWSDAEIRAFLDHVRPLIERASIVTVSLSFGYSGTEADTRRLAADVLPLIRRWRSEIRI
ncbi:hypothetical protein AB4Y38_32505 [Paraburkholderia sp. EG285A]|uniref:hypothetical protein n=1 Tax=Paraburkholderia sp. EG285A TaxID=3237009 RepID=UPI0034D2B958